MHVALTLEGRFLHLVGDQDRQPRLGLGTADIDADAVFERLELGHGRIALRTLEGGYLAVRPDAGLSYGVYPVPELSPAAAFEEILWPNGEVSLRSCHLTYVSAEPTGRVTANRTRAGLLERFFVVTVPAPAVPAQRQPARAPVAPAPRR